LRPNVTEKQANDLVRHKGMKTTETRYVEEDSSYYLIIKVPEEKEFEWMCLFEKSNIVNYAIHMVPVPA